MVDARYLTEKGARAYESKYRRGLLRRFSAAREAAALAAALRRVGAAGAILDLPCGAGRFARVLSRFAATYCGADISEPMLRICRETAGGEGKILLLQTDVRAIALRDRSFDGVVAARLLHHLTDRAERRAIISELGRVARRFLVVTFLDARTFKQRMHARRRARRGRAVRRAAVPREEIALDLRDAGFRVKGWFAISSLFSGQTAAACVRERD